MLALGDREPPVTATELDEDVGELAYSLDKFYGPETRGRADLPRGYRMDPQPACPAAEVWQEILDGSVPDAAGDCSRHLDGCHRCQAVVEALTGGGRTWLNLAAELRQPGHRL